MMGGYEGYRPAGRVGDSAPLAPGRSKWSSSPYGLYATGARVAGRRMLAATDSDACGRRSVVAANDRAGAGTGAVPSHQRGVVQTPAQSRALAGRFDAIHAGRSPAAFRGGEPAEGSLPDA